MFWFRSCYCGDVHGISAAKPSYIIFSSFKTLAELTRKPVGTYMLRVVGVDQSEQTGLFMRGTFERQLKLSI